jgi:hypothetical protein
MARLLIVVALLVFVMVATRRMLRENRGTGRRRRDSGPRPAGPPERLVCGVCGMEFDPEKSGWICPKCGK